MEGAVKFDRIPGEILLAQDKAFEEKVLSFMVPEGHIGILKENGVARKILPEAEYLYWNGLKRYSVELLDMRVPETAGKVNKAYLAQIPLKRAGSTKDIAEAAAFLASDKASYITGQVISVDGGMAI